MPVNSLRAGLVTIIIRCHCLRRFARQIRTNPTLKPAPPGGLKKIGYTQQSTLIMPRLWQNAMPIAKHVFTRPFDLALLNSLPWKHLRQVHSRFSIMNT
jgi:hypothetical protein